MWRVASMGCSTRLSSGPGMSLTELQVRVNWLSGEKPETVLDDFPPAVEPLFARPDLEALLAHMPECDEWGILPTWAGPRSWWTGQCLLHPQVRCRRLP